MTIVCWTSELLCVRMRSFEVRRHNTFDDDLLQ